MSTQTVFKRYELKYLLSREQLKAVFRAMVSHTEPDEHPRSSNRNIYYDTPDFSLIRHSLEHTDYKEKLRLRSYGTVMPDENIFVEIKKKYDSVVYKRRIILPNNAAEKWLSDTKNYDVENLADTDRQIANEIKYMTQFYRNLHPAVFLSYDRLAFRSSESPELSDLRITFDRNILVRQHDLSLTSDVYGKPVVDNELTLMEIKTSVGYPLWLCKCLADNKIYKTSFSKYGTAFTRYILPGMLENLNHMKGNY